MQAETMPHHPMNHVFVDLENVQSIDTSVIGGKNLRLNLFLGPQNKKLNVEVVEHLLGNPERVRLIRSPKAGKDALDIVLGYHLGQAVFTDPKGYFHIISKDTGYDALLELLESRNVKVKRHDDWKSLSLQFQVKPDAKASPAAPVRPAPKVLSKPALSQEAGKLLENLRKSPKNRPKKEKTLEAHARNFSGKDKPKAEAVAKRVIGELKKAKFLVVDDKGGVTYKL